MLVVHLKGLFQHFLEAGQDSLPQPTLHWLPPFVGIAENHNPPKSCVNRGPCLKTAAYVYLEAPIGLNLKYVEPNVSSLC